MKNRAILLTLFTLLALDIGCKKDDDTTPTTDNGASENSIFDLHAQMEDAKDRFFKIGEEQNVDPYAALMLTAEELEDEPTLDDVFVLDSSYLYMVKDGFTEVFALNALNPDGTSQFRGSKGSGSRFSSFGKADMAKELTNKRVLCFVPEVKDFYGSESNYKFWVLDKLNASDLDLEVDVYYGEDATYDKLRSMDLYGVVFIETHGSPDGFNVGNKKWSDPLNTNLTNVGEFRTWVNQGFGPYVLQYLIDGNARIRNQYTVKDPTDPSWWLNYDSSDVKGTYKVEMTSKGFRNLNIDLSNTVVFGNACYSGYKSSTFSDGRPCDPIQPAIMSKNPISYYGYTDQGGSISHEVENEFAKNCQDTLIQSLFYDLDTTGMAHLWNGTQIEDDPKYDRRPSIVLQFVQYGKDGYRYKNNVITDERDQEKYQVVEIGDQVWFAENLRYSGVESFVPTGQDPKIVGRLYTFSTVTGDNSNAVDGSYKKGICPKGWHVPGRVDWVKLFETLGYDASTSTFFDIGKTNEIREMNDAMVKLMVNSGEWEAKSKFTVYDDEDFNTTGMSFTPIGTGINFDTGFQFYDNGRAEYWSSSPLQQRHDGNQNPLGFDYDKGFFVEVGSKFNVRLMSAVQFEIGDPDVNQGTSACRCVKD